MGILVSIVQDISIDESPLQFAMVNFVLLLYEFMIVSSKTEHASLIVE